MHLQSNFSHQWFTQKVVLKWKNLAKPPTPWMGPDLGRCSANQQPCSFYLHFGKILRHQVDCWFSCHNKGEPRPKRCLTSVYNEITTAICHAHCSSYDCSMQLPVQGNTYSISELSFCYHFNWPENSGPIDSHRHMYSVSVGAWALIGGAEGDASPHVSAWSRGFDTILNVPPTISI